MIRLKDGVRLLGLSTPIVIAIQAAETIWMAEGADALVITSVIDRNHSRGSLHYAGLAVDFRIRNLPGFNEDGHEVARTAADRLSEALGDDFDVVLEETHVHVEWQPKESY